LWSGTGLELWYGEKLKRIPWEEKVQVCPGPTCLRDISKIKNLIFAGREVRLPKLLIGSLQLEEFWD
jgi:hypothetical protein